MNARPQSSSFLRPTLLVGALSLGLTTPAESTASVFTGNPFTVELESLNGPVPIGFVLFDDCDEPELQEAPVEVYSPGDKGEATLSHDVCGAELHVEMEGSWWSDALAMPAPGQPATPWTNHPSGLRWRVVK